LTRQRRSYDTSIQTNNDLPDDRSSLPGSILEHIADAIVYADARRERSGAGTVPPPSCLATGPQMDAGGLLSYGASFAAMGRRTAVLSIALREVRDLPVEQLTKFETRDQPQHRQNIRPRLPARGCSPLPRSTRKRDDDPADRCWFPASRSGPILRVRLIRRRRRSGHRKNGQNNSRRGGRQVPPLTLSQRPNRMKAGTPDRPSPAITMEGVGCTRAPRRLDSTGV
jgi:hypothetical protein